MRKLVLIALVSLLCGSATATAQCRNGQCGFPQYAPVAFYAPQVAQGCPCGPSCPMGGNCGAACPCSAVRMPVGPASCSGGNCRTAPCGAPFPVMHRVGYRVTHPFGGFFRRR